MYKHFDRIHASIKNALLSNIVLQNTFGGNASHSMDVALLDYFAFKHSRTKTKLNEPIKQFEFENVVSTRRGTNEKKQGCGSHIYVLFLC